MASFSLYIAFRKLIYICKSQIINQSVFSTKHVPTNRRPIIQAHSNGVQISIFPDLQDVYLSYRDYTTVNDAQWHHIAIIWDGEKGGELKLITEGLIASKVEGYGSGRKLPE